jgi:NAD(P)-dependent dehydrogenase (short-subunit alcohol dehydrogenase family)
LSNDSASLQGRVALVTGAGAGIGRGTAVALAEAGATVVATDINKASCEETADLIRGQDGRSVAYQLDVTDDDAWEAVLNEVRQFHAPVSILVNNAGVKPSDAGDGGLLDTPISTWDHIVSVDLRGPMLGARRVLPDMLEAGTGSIIMLASTVALHSVAGLATAYSSAKAGLCGLTRSIATTYGTRGVRCNAIAPGVIMVSENQERFRESIGALTERPGRPADVAAAVVFLASDGGQFVNGQVLVIDGGQTAHLPGFSVAVQS